MIKRYVLGISIATMWLCAAAANATPLIGSSSGTFDTVTSCSLVNHQVCTISPANVLTWYNNSSGQGPTTESTLTADPLSFTTAGAGTINVGELTWVAGTTNVSPDFNYNLAISITSPSSTTDNQTFALSIRNPALNPNGQTMLGLDLNLLSSMSLVFADGSTLNNFQYVVDSGTLTQSGTPGNRTDRWAVSNSSTNNLFITADYTPVPEPLTLSLFSAGLVGMAAMRRRKQHKA